PGSATRTASHALPGRTSATAHATPPATTASLPCRRGARLLGRRATAADTAAGPSGRPADTGGVAPSESPTSVRPGGAQRPPCGDRMAGALALDEHRGRVPWDASWAREHAALTSIVPLLSRFGLVGKRPHTTLNWRSFTSRTKFMVTPILFRLGSK